MKKILLLNGGKKFAHSDGCYNTTLHDTALAFLDRAGFDLKHTHTDSGYDIAEEVQKFLWADVIIYQMPGWWMGAPWTVKKYIDEVFTEGHGSLYASDGRTRSDASQKYGSGGLIHGKQYMLSLTWNAPQQAFDDPSDFFEAKGVEIYSCGICLEFYGVAKKLKVGLIGNAFGTVEMLFGGEGVISL